MCDIFFNNMYQTFNSVFKSSKFKLIVMVIKEIETLLVETLKVLAFRGGLFFTI